MDYVTREYLARSGLSPNDVQLVVDKIEAGKGVRVFSDYDIIGDQTHCVLFRMEKTRRY